ncbi:hypothetical protein K435DRAFT_808519 [Dendrothele bispora CBS 962.96]|uniref:Uncharacterized protein n=1 Tax=Dendrothele bispora (strain CBS 962.96) TaxID=1314807 RepID=A0A4V4HC74_DENBC|nr:hypothetical protein K435DRAFT_808519 [Dendrothele bispora CBS 962.96]
MCPGQFCNHPVRNPIADTGMLALHRCHSDTEVALARLPIADTGMLALHRCHSDTEVALARLPIAIRLATSGKRYDSVDSSTRYGYPEMEFRFSGVHSGSCLPISNLTKTHARPRPKHSSYFDYFLFLPILVSTPNNNTFSTPNSSSNNTPGTSTDGDNAQRPLNDPEATKYILAYNPVNWTANLVIVPNDFVPVVTAYGADTAFRHFQSEVKDQHEALAKIFSKYPDRDAAKMQKIGAAQELLTILSSAHTSSFQDVMVNDLGFMENSFISARSLAKKAFNQLQEAIPASHSKVNSLVARYHKFRDDNDRRQKERGDQNIPPVAVVNMTPADGQTTNSSTAPTTLQPAATIRSGPVRGCGRGLSVAGRTVNSSAHAPPNPDQDVAMADLSSSVDPNATPVTPANPPGTKSQKSFSQPDLP